MQGICHVVLPERGHLRPGMFAVGGDSHSPTGGAFAAYMFGVGATEMLGVLVTGEIWLQVPHTIAMDFSGRFARRRVGEGRDAVPHRPSSAWTAASTRRSSTAATRSAPLPMQERMTLCNMAAELGAQTGLIASDSSDRKSFLNTEDRNLGQRSRRALSRPSPLQRRGARAAGRRAAQPGELQAGQGVRERQDQLRLHRRLHRREARRPAHGRAGLQGQESPESKLVVAPASLRDQQTAETRGHAADPARRRRGAARQQLRHVRRLRRHLLGPDVVAISTTARNFKGRMGSPAAQVYLASPYTVAASAIAGRIRDPREALA